MYIVIEGQDGTGKSTEAYRLAEYFKKQGKTVKVIEEPDGELSGIHDIHDLILIRGKEYDFTAMTNVALFTAARIELWEKEIRPILDNGGIVISARNYWSTIAYQGYGQGADIDKIIRITEESLPEKYCHPDKAVILVTDDSIRLSRQSDRGKAIETFEAKDNSFQELVNAAYPKIAKRFNVPMLDASDSIEKVEKSLHKLFGL